MRAAVTMPIKKDHGSNGGSSRATTGYARPAAPPTVPPVEFTSAWTDLKNLEQRISDAHNMLTELEQRIGSVLAPTGPDSAGSATGVSEANSPLVESVRGQFNAVDFLVVRILRIKDRVEL